MTTYQFKTNNNINFTMKRTTSTQFKQILFSTLFLFMGFSMFAGENELTNSKITTTDYLFNNNCSAGIHFEVKSLLRTFSLSSAVNIISTSKQNETCALNDGSISIVYDVVPNQTSVEFSIDGGLTYPYSSSMTINQTVNNPGVADPFTCQSAFYQEINSTSYGAGQLFVVDINTSTFLPIGNPSGFNINAVGYRTSDNFIYGIASSAGTDALGAAVAKGNVIKIDSEGETFLIANVDLNSASGAVNGDYLWVGKNGLTKFNLTTGVIDEVVATTTNMGSDMVIIDDVVYSGSGSSIRTADLTTIQSGQTLTVNSYTVDSLPSNGGYGAMWAATNSSTGLQELYFSNNNTGYIYRIDDYTTTTPTAIYVGASAVTGNNDGTSCPLASPGLDAGQGSFTIPNLAAGTYDVWARWGDGSSPVSIDSKTINAAVTPNVTSTTSTNENCAELGTITFTYDVEPSQTGVRFSIDGGATYPYLSNMTVNQTVINPGVADAFPCQSGFYQVINSTDYGPGQLFVLDILTNTYLPIGNNTGFNINAIGYRTSDNFIYGIATSSGFDALGTPIANKDLIKIDSEGEAFKLASLGVSSNNGSVLGDYLMITAGTNLYHINLNTNSIETTTPLSQSIGVDFIIIDNKIYSAKHNTLYTADLNAIQVGQTLTVNQVTVDGLPTPGGYGAIWGARDDNGNDEMYVSNNYTGKIYKISDYNTGSPTAANVAQGTITGNNDGTSCPLTAAGINAGENSYTINGLAADTYDLWVMWSDNSCPIDLSDVTISYDSIIPGTVFTKVDNSPLITDSKDNWASAFGDYDNDGFVDLFVPNYDLDQLNELYHNNGDGTFTKVTSGNPIVTDLAPSTSGVWGDYDNDGDLDLYVSNNIGYNNFLYRNEGSGNFTSIQNDPIVNYNGYSHGATWADYDNDGYVDMFITDYFPTRFNKLYHNNGDGTFEEVTNSPLVVGASFSVSSTWGDYDNDGDQDLFVANTSDENNYLYKNEGSGQFTQITTGDIVNDGGKSVGASWGDYDNDMDLDLFVANSGGQTNFLYQNNGDGTFTKVTTGVVVTTAGNSHGSSWGDTDNDGDLDLLVSNDADEDNTFYTNNGDGTFTLATNSATQDAGRSFGLALGDIDNDLDLDLFVANHDDEANLFYKNNNSTCASKACITLVGTNTNASAFGTKIKVLTTVNGVQQWQMRELSSLTGGGTGGQNDLKTLIGLGEATQMDSMIIEWASGIVQVFGTTQVDTCFVITEDFGSKLCGKVYNDKNLNCTQDNGEDGIPNVAVTVTPGNRQVFTDDNGEYEFNLAPGTYTVTQVDNETWKPSCAPLSHTVNVIGIGNEYCGYNFADTAACQSPDLNVDLATTSLRVGFESLYALSFGNDGTEPATNTIVTTTFDADIVVLSASLPWDTKTGNTYTWNIGTMEVGQEFTIYIEDSISATAVIGENLTVIATIASDETDCNATDDIATDVNEAVGAIDPNDILVSPEGFIANDQVLTYKIRFQNVGNDLVNRVVLRDELPDNLDLSTLVRGAASHPYQFRIEGERTLVWEFDNINLLDSTTNEPESHGFATFRITPNVELPDGEEIPNKAAIFFDNSAPIITNTVINIIGEPGDIKPGEMSIFPNPMTDYTVIRILPRQEGLNLEEISSIEIFTTVGHRVMSMNNLTGTRVTIQREELPAGYYIVKATSNKGVFYVGKLLVE